MPVEAVFGVLAFGGMFVAWAVVPSILKKRHSANLEGESSKQNPWQPTA
ncbi:MAG: hypothetical protein HYX99_01335 [Chloroflexi bacterium]|nr:hypothetical protein [Chloroflexota bacterium]